MFGIILVIIGLVFLLRNLGLITGDIWDIVWPCLLIAIGLKFIFRRKYNSWDKLNKFGEHMNRFGEHMDRFGEEMKKEFTKDKK
jgi:hypothetical protein